MVLFLSLGKGNECKLFEFFFQIVQNCPLLISKSDSIDRVVDTKLASTTSCVIFAKSDTDYFFLTFYFHVAICSGNIHNEHDRAHPLYVQINFFFVKHGILLLKCLHRKLKEMYSQE